MRRWNFGECGQWCFNGMIQKHKFNVVLVQENAGVGDQPMNPALSVNYSGKRQMVVMGRKV